jgi:membrane protein DedA with SNARE-associated domain
MAMTEIINLLINFGQKFSYEGVFLLMTLESTFLPIPSELVVPPAAFLAGQGDLNLLFVIISGVLGSMTGATINYFLGKWIGQPLLYVFVNHKYAKFFLLNEDKLKKAENYFLRGANWATFLGRLVPGVRHLISIPAGFSKMNFFDFLLYTFLGSSFWVTILAILGYFFGANQVEINNYLWQISVVFALVFIVFIIWWARKSKKNK